MQSCHNDVSLKQLGRKLVGPASTPIMTQKVKELEAERSYRHKDVGRVFASTKDKDPAREEAVRAHRTAKA